VDGAPLDSAQRVAYESTVAIVAQYLAEAPGFRAVPPTLTFTGRLTLARGGRVVEVRHFGHGNTRGDAVVYLPAEGVVATGDLVNVPVPSAYGGHLPGWIAAIDSVLALGPKVIVPGHGPVLRDGAHARLLQDAMRAIRDQVGAAVARGDSLPQVRAAVRLDDLRTRIAGEHRMWDFFFRNWFLSSAVSGEHRRLTGGGQNP
jgi:glyoxylase-like metal-dependent hydrolase (beta-lactamase superfamily II)